MLMILLALFTVRLIFNNQQTPFFKNSSSVCLGARNMLLCELTLAHTNSLDMTRWLIEGCYLHSEQKMLTFPEHLISSIVSFHLFLRSCLVRTFAFFISWFGTSLNLHIKTLLSTKYDQTNLLTEQKCSPSQHFQPPQPPSCSGLSTQ